MSCIFLPLRARASVTVVEPSWAEAAACKAAVTIVAENLDGRWLADRAAVPGLLGYFFYYFFYLFLSHLCSGSSVSIRLCGSMRVGMEGCITSDLMKAPSGWLRLGNGRGKNEVGEKEKKDLEDEDLVNKYALV